MAQEKILCIDIGGSNIKATVLNSSGAMLEPYVKKPTPAKSTPENVLAVIKDLAAGFAEYHKVSVGFPGYVKNNTVITAPNLGTKSWTGFALAKKITGLLKKPCHVLNDADMQGLGIAKGKGLEMVVTLGTGFGTAILMDGKLLPHMELAHFTIEKEYDLDKYIGEAALLKLGVRKWNKRVAKLVSMLKTVFNYDHLYIGGGNANEINFKLDANITIVNNKDGIKGGARVWR
ncbi:ROK family protein [Foetidibacter luteolus]|uniref:ROK family protein n=1 Tax=Foetidibacter luteolus TaxID=2608880 RepID=UPI00129A2BE9|nr:ROK family protein [Foetidibacter luteolus]